MINVKFKGVKTSLSFRKFQKLGKVGALNTDDSAMIQPGRDDNGFDCYRATHHLHALEINRTVNTPVQKKQQKKKPSSLIIASL